MYNLVKKLRFFSFLKFAILPCLEPQFCKLRCTFQPLISSPEDRSKHAKVLHLCDNILEKSGDHQESNDRLSTWFLGQNHRRSLWNETERKPNVIRNIFPIKIRTSVANCRKNSFNLQYESAFSKKPAIGVYPSATDWIVFCNTNATFLQVCRIFPATVVSK